jgi:serralysin
MANVKEKEEGANISDADLKKIHACVDYPVGKSLPDYGAMPMALKWPNGSTLRVLFLDGDPAVHAKVAQFAVEWSDYANITFNFNNDLDAEIRISFQYQGSWSTVGTDALNVPDNKPTMNYGWLTPTTSDDEYQRVVVHEFGHAIGLIHEHSSPAAGSIHWNKPVVYRYYEGPPNNWTQQDVDFNLFQTYNATQTNFTALDPTSIMMYPIPAGFTTDGLVVGWNSVLSATDKAFIAQMYPKAKG